MPQERDNTKAKKPAKEAGEASAPFLSLLGWRMTGESNNASERRDRTSPATWLRPSGSHPGPGPGLRGEGWGGYLFGSSPWPGLQWGSWCSCSCSWCSCSCSWWRSCSWCSCSWCSCSCSWCSCSCSWCSCSWCSWCSCSCSCSLVVRGRLVALVMQIA